MYNRSDSSRASIRSFLFPCLLFFRGSHTTSFVTCGFSRSYNQVAQVPSSKVTCNSPRSPWINSRMTFALVSITHSITSFPASFLTAIEMLSLCTSIPIYLQLVIKGCSFLEGLSTNTQNLLPKGRPFILRRAGSDGQCNTIWYKSVFKGGVYETRETIWAFGGAETRRVASLESRADFA